MSITIERAVFYEGQILGAADLTTAAEYDRNQQARHERYLHLWGIAAGLQLTGKDKKDAQDRPYQEVTLGAGLAIDGWGREIVVTQRSRWVPVPADLVHSALDRAGDCRDDACVQVVPAHSHVSASGPPSPCPPNSTIFSIAGS